MSMIVRPVLTEKSLKDAKEGKYTFSVAYCTTKYKIAELVGKVFGVHVKKVWVIKKGPELKRSYSRKNPTMRLAQKRAVVTLAKGEKIEIFEEVA